MPYERKLRQSRKAVCRGDGGGRCDQVTCTPAGTASLIAPHVLLAPARIRDALDSRPCGGA